MTKPRLLLCAALWMVALTQSVSATNLAPAGGSGGVYRADFALHSVYRRRAVSCLISSLPLLVAACGDPDTAQQQASSTPTAQSEASSMRAFPTRDLCPPRPRSAHENQSGPIYVAAGSIAAGHETDTPEDLAARSEMVVDGRVVRLTAGRANEFWGYVNVHLRIEQNRADKPAPDVAVFEQAVCENPLRSAGAGRGPARGHPRG